MLPPDDLKFHFWWGIATNFLQMFDRKLALGSQPFRVGTSGTELADDFDGQIRTYCEMLRMFPKGLDELLELNLHV